jgi:choline monooxygenase
MNDAEQTAQPAGARAEAFTREETYAATRRPVSLAETLLPEAYTSEAFFALERERVFGSTWVAVGCSARLREPGDVLVAEVAGRSIFVVRKQDGALRAFYNVCRHRGTQLLAAGERRVKRFIRCPYHSWAYDHDGRCVGTPMFTGSDIPVDQQAAFDMQDVAAFDRADYGLLPVAVDSWGPLVFVNLEADPEPLADHLGDLPARTAGYRLDEWQIARTAEYEIAANYKLVAENFMEYYHLPWVHPGLVKVSPMEAHHRWQGTGMYVGFCTSPIAPDTDDGGWQSGLAPLSGLNDADATSARFIWLFPNVAVNILPNHLFVILARPVTPGLTYETTYLLTRPESAGAAGTERAVDEIAKFWDAVNREDIDIVQRVQAGLDSTPFPGGRLCYRFEESLHRFQNMIIDRMVGKRRVPPGDEAVTVPMFPPAAGRTSR